jgi:hypothetical protein
MEIGWKTTFSELHKRQGKIRRISMVKTGSTIPIRADTIIDDFSFQSSKPLETNTMVKSSEVRNIITLDEISPSTDLVFYEKD